MKFCTECGFEFTPGAKFCGECGGTLVVAADDPARSTRSRTNEGRYLAHLPAEVLQRAGQDLVSRADAGDAAAMNDLGIVLKSDGFQIEALELFRRSALAGLPWAMSNYSWHVLLQGNPQAAVDLYSEASRALQEMAESSVAERFDGFDFQLANARSNVALCHLAVGLDHDQALTWWDAGAALGHTESLFYPLIADFRHRKSQASERESIHDMVRLSPPSVAVRQRAWGLTHEQVQQLKQDLTEGMNCAYPWFSEWCRDGNLLLQDPEEGPDWAQVDQATQQDKDAREVAREEIISSVNHIVMEACAARAHATGNLIDCEFWWLEIATAPASDEVIARGVEGLCSLILLPQRRTYEARLYFLHLISRTNPEARAIGIEGLNKFTATQGLYHDAGQQFSRWGLREVTAEEGFDHLLQSLNEKMVDDDLYEQMGNNDEFLSMAAGWLIGFNDSVSSDPSLKGHAPLAREIAAKALTEFLTTQGYANISTHEPTSLDRLAEAGVPITPELSAIYSELQSNLYGVNVPKSGESVGAPEPKGELPKTADPGLGGSMIGPLTFQQFANILGNLEQVVGSEFRGDNIYGEWALGEGRTQLFLVQDEPGLASYIIVSPFARADLITAEIASSATAGLNGEARLFADHYCCVRTIPYGCDAATLGEAIGYLIGFAGSVVERYGTYASPGSKHSWDPGLAELPKSSPSGLDAELPKSSPSGLDSKTPEHPNTPGEPPSPLSLNEIPDAGTWDQRALQKLPNRPEGESLSNDLQMAIQLLIDSDATAEHALRECVGQEESLFGQAVARMQLGALLAQTQDEEKRNEAAGLLVWSLRQKFKDVVGPAAWNLRNLFMVGEAAVKAEGYAELAMALGNEVAAVCVAEDAVTEGSETSFYDKTRKLNQACTVIRPGSSYRERLTDAIAGWILPKYSEGVQDWFTAASRQLSPETLRDLEGGSIWDKCILRYRHTGTAFNVEASNASVATQYFKECGDSCYFNDVPHLCTKCDRQSRNFLSCMAGDGDGYYGVHQLLDDLEGEEVTIGAMTLFAPAIDDIEEVQLRDYMPDGSDLNLTEMELTGTGLVLGTLFHESAPLVLGKLDVQDSILFSDCSKTIDGRDITIVRDLPRGDYTVIAWIGLNRSHCSLRPQALMVLPVERADQLLASIPTLSDDLRDQVIKDTYGSGTEIVSSHVNQAAYIPNLQQNARNAARGARPDEGASFLMQGAEFIDEGLYEVLRNMTDLGSDADQRASLQRRGIYNPTFPWRAAR